MNPENPSTKTDPQKPPTLTPLPADPTIGQLMKAIKDRDDTIRYKDTIIKALQASQLFAVPSFDLAALTVDQKDGVIKVLTKTCLRLPAVKLPAALFKVVGGEYRYSEGLYEGELVCGKPHGKGLLRLEKGGAYEGEFVNGKKDGRGVFKWASGAVYEGEWREGKRNGQGTYTASNGIQFTGYYKDDKKVGLGTVTLVDGIVQTAQHEDGKLHGQCIELSSTKQAIWLKLFDHEKPNGTWLKYDLAEERTYDNGVLINN